MKNCDEQNGVLNMDKLFENDMQKKILERAGLKDEVVEKVLKESVTKTAAKPAATKNVKISKRVDESAAKKDDFDVEGFVRKLVKEAFEDFGKEPEVQGSEESVATPPVDGTEEAPLDAMPEEGGEEMSADPVQDAIAEVVEKSAGWDDAQKEAYVQGISKEFWGGTAEFEDGETTPETPEGGSELPAENEGAMGTEDELMKPPV